jgi:hypothetical protein
VLSLLVSTLIAIIPLLSSQSSVSGPPSSVFILPNAIIAGAFLIANLAASVYTSFNKGWRYLPLLPLVFAILHISYGLGFLVGLVIFWNR